MLPHLLVVLLPSLLLGPLPLALSLVLLPQPRVMTETPTPLLLRPPLLRPLLAEMLGAVVVVVVVVVWWW